MGELSEIGKTPPYENLKNSLIANVSKMRIFLLFLFVAAASSRSIKHISSEDSEVQFLPHIPAALPPMSVEQKELCDKIAENLDMMKTIRERGKKFYEKLEEMEKNVHKLSVSTKAMLIVKIMQGEM